MPIYEFMCEKCGKKLEILTSPDLIPRICGPRCVADDRAGDGELRRIVSPPARPPRGGRMPGKIDPDRAAEKGFTTFKKQRGGGYERVAGDFGPEHFVPPDLD